jgi:hypothetical protein
MVQGQAIRDEWGQETSDSSGSAGQGQHGTSTLYVHPIGDPTGGPHA